MNGARLWRVRCLLAGASFMAMLGACAKRSPSHAVVLDMVLFNYLPRPIFDVFLNGKASHSSFAFPETGGGTIVGVEVPFGPQKLTWRLDGPEGMAGNGDVVTARNQADLRLEVVAANAQFIAVHIYPDDSAELITTQHYPRETERGRREGEAASTKVMPTATEKGLP